MDGLFFSSLIYFFLELYSTKVDGEIFVVPKKYKLIEIRGKGSYAYVAYVFFWEKICTYNRSVLQDVLKIMKWLQLKKIIMFFHYIIKMDKKLKEAEVKLFKREY